MYSPNDSLDREWFRRHLLEELLPRWRAACLTESGLFVSRLDRQWRSRGGDSAILVGQSRLLHNFAVGFRLTGEEAYRAAAQQGARFLIAHFLDPAEGGCFWSCAVDGRALDMRKDAYAHAFALFGLSHAFAATGEAACLEAAQAVREVLRRRFRDDHGGLIPAFTRDFQPLSTTRSQNPVMHLFEALLALGEQEGMESALAEAGEIARFVTTQLIRAEDGALPELFTPDWQPLVTETGGRIEIGHQFEWAYLLSRGVEQGLPADLLSPAKRLLDRGMQLGYDAGQGGIFSTVSMEGALKARSKGWWEQCEAARALMRFAVRHQDTSLQQPLAKTLEFCRTHLIDCEYGGWFMRVEPDGSVSDTDKGTDWKVDYHVVGLCVEALRLLPAGQIG